MFTGGELEPTQIRAPGTENGSMDGRTKWHLLPVEGVVSHRLRWLKRASAQYLDCTVYSNHKTDDVNFDTRMLGGKKYDVTFSIKGQFSR